MEIHVNNLGWVGLASGAAARIYWLKTTQQSKTPHILERVKIKWMHQNSKKEKRQQRVEQALKNNINKRKIFQNKFTKENKKVKK